MNQKLPDVQADLEKAEEPEIKLLTSTGSLQKQENSRKTSTSALLPTLKPLTVWITTNCGKFSELGIPDHITCLLRNLYAVQGATVRTRHGTMDWVPNWERSIFSISSIKAVYCHPDYLISMQNTSCKMLGWMRQKLESRLPGEISVTSDM